MLDNEEQEVAGDDKMVRTSGRRLVVHRRSVARTYGNPTRPACICLKRCSPLPVLRTSSLGLNPAGL